MQIHWNNIITLMFLVVVGLLLVKFFPEAMVFLQSMKDIGPGHATDEKASTLIGLGLVCACLVAVVKVLTSQRK